MNLGELIKTLEAYPREQLVPFGFGKGLSYRGIYEDIAFEPVKDTTVGAMLDAARLMIGAVCTGYKGGNYEMCEFSTCWIAEWGYLGEQIGPLLLRYMLGKPIKEEVSLLAMALRDLKSAEELTAKLRAEKDALQTVFDQAKADMERAFELGQKALLDRALNAEARLELGELSLMENCESWTAPGYAPMDIYASTSGSSRENVIFRAEVGDTVYCVRKKKQPLPQPPASEGGAS